MLVNIFRFYVIIMTKSTGMDYNSINIYLLEVNVLKLFTQNYELTYIHVVVTIGGVYRYDRYLYSVYRYDRYLYSVYRYDRYLYSVYR